MQRTLSESAVFERLEEMLANERFGIAGTWRSGSVPSLVPGSARLRAGGDLRADAGPAGGANRAAGGRGTRAGRRAAGPLGGRGRLGRAGSGAAGGNAGLGLVPVAERAQLRYLIGSAEGWLGALGFAATALRLAARERWMGWSDAQRRAHLDLAVGLSRFLVRGGCANLASHVLGRALRCLPED